jgi:hypothetical protein
MGLDAETYWPTDRQPQCDFDFDLFRGFEFRDASLSGYEMGAGVLAVAE